MPRKYTKKSEYWDKFPKKEESIENLMSQQSQASNEEIVPATAGESYYTQASCPRNLGQVSGERATRRRSNKAANAPRADKYKNIADTALPYSYSKNYISPKDSILLCQKAYANVPIFRNAVDVMAEFSNSDIYLEGGSEKSKSFIDKWLNKIQIWKLKDQYFREYYRSGNIFLYRVDGQFSKQDFDNLSKIYGSTVSLKPGKLPVKYIVLNPYDIVAARGSSFETALYEKILSEYDIERLKNPKTDYDLQVFESLDEEIKEKIKSGKYNQDGIKVKLDPDHLVYSFYKKQDYEPFAIPFGYPVLDDINFKLELKKIDQAICRTIENVILLITMGAEPDKGGINPRNMEAMQNLFKNESVGRVLVSDYTTKAQFIIPDIGKVVGPAKYEVINNDIKEGLQNVIVGDERYSNTQVKAKIFLERLKESRNAFIYDFLQPQIKMICQNLGFRKYPKVKFEETDIKDEVQLQRVATRLMELGIITPAQGMTALEKGIYPNPQDLEPAQREYVEQRKDGLYNPIVGGVPMVAPETNEDSSDQTNQVKNEVGRPVGTSDIPQESSAALFSRENIQNTIYSSEELTSFATSEIKNKLNKKRLKKQEKQMIDELCQSVIISTENKYWKDKIKICINDSSNIESLYPMVEVQDLAAEHNLDLYSAALLYHSKREF